MKNLKAAKITCALFLFLLLAACSRSPQVKEMRFLASGRAWMVKKDYARAVLEFRNAVHVMPNDPQAYYELAMSSLAAGDTATAVAALKKTLALNPNHQKAQLQIARLMSTTQNPGLLNEAEKRLNALLEGNSSDPEALHALALTELKLGKIDAAVQNLEQILAKSPAALNSSLVLAEVKIAQKDLKGAEQVLKQACDSAPQSADPHVVLGTFYGSQNRLADAQAQFSQALQINPKSGQALLEIAKLQRLQGQKQQAEQSFQNLANLGDPDYAPVYALFLFEENRRDEAIREFERLYKIDPQNRAARTRLIAAYQAINKPAEAEKILSNVLKDNPKDSEALLQRAEFFIGSQKFNQAEADLNQVLHLRPTSPEAHYILAKLHQARKESLNYRQELSMALQLNGRLLPIRLELARALLEGRDAKASLETLDEAPNDQRASTEVIVQRNWALWALGDVAAMRKATDQQLSKQKSAELLTQDGLLKLRSGDFAGARRSLEEALKLNPSDLMALQTLPRTYKGSKETQLAVQKVKEYAARQPQSAPVQTFLGTLLMANGQRNEAREAFAAAKASDPRAVAPNLFMVQLEAAEGKWDSAASTLKTVLSTDVNNVTARVWQGNVEEIRGNHDAALEAFRKAVELDPNNAQALNNLAYALAAYRNKASEALPYAEKAQELAPQEPAYSDTLGWILYQKGLYSLALKPLQIASASRSLSVVPQYHLAMAYAKAGDTKRGKAVLERALKENPHVPEAKTAIDLLNALQ